MALSTKFDRPDSPDFWWYASPQDISTYKNSKKPNVDFTSANTAKKFFDGLENADSAAHCSEMSKDVQPPILATNQPWTQVLMRGIKCSDYQLADWALQRGANPNEQFKGGESLLMRLAAKGDCPGIELLTEYGAQVNLRNDEDETALFYAMGEGQWEAAQLLIEKGASETVRTQYGLQPRYCAFFMGHLTDPSLLDEHEKALFYYKGFCHATNTTKLVSIDGVMTEGEGSRGITMWHLFHRAISLIIERKKGEYTTSSLEKIAAAYSFAVQHFQDLEALAEQIQSRQLTFIKSGWCGHAVACVFLRGYLVICNRGAQWKDNAYLPIAVHKIDSKKITPDILKRVQLNAAQTKDAGAHFLYVTLPALLKAEGVPLIDKTTYHFENLVTFPPQETDTCGFVSPLTAGQFTYAFQTRHEVPRKQLQKNVTRLEKDIRHAAAEICWKFLRRCPFIEFEKKDRWSFERKYTQVFI